MKNKGWAIIGVLLWEYFFVMLCSSLGLTTTGGTLLEIPSNPNFLDIITTSFNTFVGLLTFSVVGIPDILILFTVYFPLIIALVALYLLVRGD